MGQAWLALVVGAVLGWMAEADNRLGRLMWMDQMTSAKRNILLNEHNRLRGLEPAANMQKMVWDSGLEALARQRTRMCNAAHSFSSFRSNKAGYSYIGENIWWSTESRLRSNLDSIILEFYKEKPFYNFRTTGCQRGQMCGHYTQVVWHDSCAVGCAIARCSNIANGAFIRNGHILVCHYGKGGNYRGRQPYLLGPKCSRCESGGCTSDGFCQPTCRANLSPFPARPAPRRSPAPAQTPARRPAPASTARPTPRRRNLGGTSRSCTATSTMCTGWAGMGECDKNPRYMNSCCRAACQALTPSSSAPRSTPRRASRRTTALPRLPPRPSGPSLPSQPRPSSGGGPQLSIASKRRQSGSSVSESSSTRCVNTHALCPFWAARDECRSNAQWMGRFCTHACRPDLCAGKAATLVGARCTDDSPYCGLWARRNECANSEDYMAWKCRRSCRLC